MSRPFHPRTATLTQGFTLIEVMIVVAVIGILSSIAYPSYTGYVLRAKITEATAKLEGLQADMERHYQNNNNSYLNAPACNTPKVGSFVISCSKLEDHKYILQAEGEGFTFSVNENNLKETKGASQCSGWATNKGQLSC